ncbi:putative ABC transport system permease protein [Hephaestia caeni]|uniref:Putative ABC transport system permease protein n=1 Tax=Hephaestia caeni TaxID=645617 RepID=A0A397P899_9SPHN|nr:ABC transporter permease [Hephaestia caeni]RIA44543.1 putative ABC transport system permease protein [Hephaestia caeni]
MWRNYLTVALRALAKNRAYTIINIAGLSLGIAACLLILSYVRYEFSYDEWLPDSDNVFQLQDFYHATDEGGEEMKLQQTSYVTGQRLKKDFPQVENAVYFTSQAIVVLQNGQPSTVPGALFVDGNLFDVLHVPFVRGDPAHALDDPHSLVLGEKAAAKYFGSDDPIGKTLTLASRDLKEDYRVTGVFRDLPKNSSLGFGMVARFDPASYWQATPGALTSWSWQEGGYWLRLKSSADAAAIEAQLPAWEKRNIPDENDGVRISNPGEFQDWKLVNIRDVHLGAAQGGAQTPGNDKTSIVTFAVIAMLILGMACVNFTNLATARATQRAREVALRKVLGATRQQLITQFLGESILVAAAAMLVALALVELTLPALNGFLDAQIAVRYVAADGLILPVIALTLIVGIAGGLYPALVLSRFEPARVLKANRSAAGAEGSGRLRGMLVVAQFAVSIGLIICTAIVYAQTSYARNVDAGYKRDGLLQLDGIGRPQAEQVADALMQQVRRIPGVVAVGRTNIAVANGHNSVTDVQVPGSPNHVALGVYGTDQGFFDAMGIRLLAGRTLSDARPMDDATTPSPALPEAQQALAARGVNILVSREAARRLGFARPQDAIGKQIKTPIVDSEYGLVPSTIVGVVDDVRYRSVRDPLQPIFYLYDTGIVSQLMIRFQGRSPSAVYDQVETVWQRLVPDIPFQARFVDDIVNDLYNRDERRAQLFGAFAVLAVVIGCLGLFGLAAFTAERRTKEIGIRKVLGARTRDIVRLLVWQFSRPVLIANVIAWPVAWWAMRSWLNGFEVRMPLGPVPFVAAGVLALVIAILTIGTHAWRVARTNPVKALRYE